MESPIVIKNRLNWIDWAKTIAIMLVVFGHIPEDEGNFLIHYVVLIHMPLFFFISGYLTKKEFLCKTTLKKYYYTLIIPYFCYNIIFIPYWVVRHFIEVSNAEWYDIIRPILGTLLLQFSSSFCEPLNEVTWFIAALLAMKIILSICNKLKYGIAILFVLAIISTLTYIINEGTRLCTDLPFVGFVKCLPFFLLGHFCKQKNWICEKPKKMDLFLCLAGISISLAAYAFKRNTPGLMVYGVCFWTSSITAIISILSLCKSLDKIYMIIIDNISIGTIVIMGLHWILIGVTNFTLSKLLHAPNITYPVWGAILLTFIYTAVLYPVIILFKNYYPFLLGKNIAHNKSYFLKNENY